MKILARANKKLRGNGKFYTIPEPTKSWFYVTEYDSNGYPIKAKTIGCSGDMPYEYMYSSYDSSYKNAITRFLEEFKINDGVTNIVKGALRYCSSLTSITIPNSVTSIGASAFQYCTSLASITIPNSVTSIGVSSFFSCTSLINIIIPSGVTSIGTYAFKQCTSLASITIPDSVTSIGGDSFTQTGLISITIPNGIKSIENYTFSSCTKLTSIKFGSGITSIGTSAFSSCSKCLLFDFRKATSVPTLSNVNAFQGTSSSKKIVVPDALYDTWITATNWSSTSNNIVTSIIKASDYEASL